MTAPLYFVENQFRTSGRAFLETDRDQNSRQGIIDLIASGEIHPIKILEVYEDEGTVRNVTSEIMEAAGIEQVEIAGLPEENIREVDLVAIVRDHKRDLRKHEVV